MNINDEANMLINLEQLKELLPTLANVCKCVFDEYKKVGFDDEQALRLTIDYQKNITGNTK